MGVAVSISLAAILGLAACGSPGATGTPGASGQSGPTPTTSPTPAATPDPTSTPTLEPASNVTAFFYMWYGSDAHDSTWRHWNQNGHTPPDDIASQFYPERGPYSSRDPLVMAAQMADLRSARIGVIAVSWWGQGGWDDQGLDALFAAAETAGVKIAFHLEPYQGQTAASAAADIRYLLGRFGSSPALYRLARATSGDASTAPRPVFYIFAPSRMPAADLKAAIHGLRGTADDAILMVHSPRAVSATRVGADGVYTYDPMGSPADFKVLVADCRTANLICSPSVSPGFDNRQAVAVPQPVIGRQNGGRYDSMWLAAIATMPEWISIVSFDEWHEGTQIEPARDFTAGMRTYVGYEGAFDATGADAPRAYLGRTLHWVNDYSPAPGG